MAVLAEDVDAEAGYRQHCCVVVFLGGTFFVAEIVMTTAIGGAFGVHEDFDPGEEGRC